MPDRAANSPLRSVPPDGTRGTLDQWRAVAAKLAFMLVSRESPDQPQGILENQAAVLLDQCLGPRGGPSMPDARAAVYPFLFCPNDDMKGT